MYYTTRDRFVTGHCFMPIRGICYLFFPVPLLGDITSQALVHDVGFLHTPRYFPVSSLRLLSISPLTEPPADDNILAPISMDSYSTVGGFFWQYFSYSLQKVE